MLELKPALESRAFAARRKQTEQILHTFERTLNRWFENNQPQNNTDSSKDSEMPNQMPFLTSFGSIRANELFSSYVRHFILVFSYQIAQNRTQ